MLSFIIDFDTRSIHEFWHLNDSLPGVISHFLDPQCSFVYLHFNKFLSHFICLLYSDFSRIFVCCLYKQLNRSVDIFFPVLYISSYILVRLIANRQTVSLLSGCLPARLCLLSFCLSIVSLSIRLFVCVCRSVCLFTCLQSVCLSVCLFVCLSVCLSECLSVCLFFLVFFVCLSVCLFVYGFDQQRLMWHVCRLWDMVFSLFVCLSLAFCLSVCCPSVYTRFLWWMCVFLFVCISVCLSCLFVCLSVCLCVCVSVCLSVCLCLCLSFSLTVCFPICLPPSLSVASPSFVSLAICSSIFSPSPSLLSKPQYVPLLCVYACALAPCSWRLSWVLNTTCCIWTQKHKVNSFNNL